MHVKPLPPTLAQGCKAAFEERLWSQALSLFQSCLTAGTGTPVVPYLPEPSYLALVATLCIHPSLTTRTNEQEKHRAADHALDYLRHVNQLVGAEKAGFKEAFEFGNGVRAGDRRGKRAIARSSTSIDNDDHIDRIRNSLAGEDSLWNNASSFWTVVGWAFNCSVLHQARWERWRLWLDLMLDILETDLTSRIEQAQDSDAADDATEDCLLAHFLSSVTQGRNNKRILMRAILADGSPKSVAEFPEIWKDETKSPARPRPEHRNDDRSQKRRKLDLEAGEYGDYFNESDKSDDEASTDTGIRKSPYVGDEEEASSQLAESDNEHTLDEIIVRRPSRSRSNSTSTSTSAPPAPFGDTHSIRLRERLLALLAQFSAHTSTLFDDMGDLFALYTEFLQPLPLSVFTHFVLPAQPYLNVNEHSLLDQMMLQALLETAAPPNRSGFVTQAAFQTCYAPFAANAASRVANAKVALLVESVFRLLWRSAGLKYSRELVSAVESGIKARGTKGLADGRRKRETNAELDREASVVLEASGKRMRAILDLVKSSSSL